MHLKAGISDADWIQRALNEAKNDPVGMWQIVKVGREGFGLSHSALEDFVQRFVLEMVAGGAGPVIGDRSATSGWVGTTKYGVEPKDVANALVAEWKSSGIDPDVDGIWFAFPAVWNKNR